jgi:hypothetical protein
MATAAAAYAAGTSVHPRAGTVKPARRDVDLLIESPSGSGETGRQEGL